MRSLLLSASSGLSQDDVAGLSATELRDALLVLDPLDREWVARVNRAEAEFWKRCVCVCGPMRDGFVCTWACGCVALFSEGS